MSRITLIFEPRSIYHISEVRICQSLWNQSKMRKLLKDKLVQFPLAYNSPYQIVNLLEHRDKNNEILHQVYNNIDELVLPTEFKHRLKILAKAMGIMIWDFLEGMNDDLLGDLSCYVDHIKWSSDWTIDTAETFRSMYYSKKFPDSNRTWTKLSNYCLEDCLQDFLARVKAVHYVVPKATRGNPQKRVRRDPCDIIKDIFSLYWSNLMQNRLDKFSTHLHSLLDQLEDSSYNKSETMKVNMFKVAFADRNISAVKYFWELLTEEERINIIADISRHEPMSFYTKSFRKSYVIDSAISIRKHVSAYGDNRFLTDILDDSFITRRIFNWPWEDLFTRTLEESWPHITDSDLESMLAKMSLFLFLYFLRDDGNIGKYCCIFRQIWSKIDNDYKKSMSLSCYTEHLCSNPECLGHIINDPALSDRRHDLIETTARVCESYGVTRERIDQFCAEVLKNDEERAFFRKRAIYTETDSWNSDDEDDDDSEAEFSNDNDD